MQHVVNLAATYVIAHAAHAVMHAELHAKQPYAVFAVVALRSTLVACWLCPEKDATPYNPVVV